MKNKDVYLLMAFVLCLLSVFWVFQLVMNHQDLSQVIAYGWIIILFLYVAYLCFKKYKS